MSDSIASAASNFCLNETLTGKYRHFVPTERKNVKMFTCGPSVYRVPHLGNYRTFLFEDVLYRYLRFLGYSVHRVINFTDVEDKAIAEAKSNGVSLVELTDRVEKRFFEDSRKLKIHLPTTIPRSSTSVDMAVHVISVLMKKGIAYRHGEDIFFDPLKYDKFGQVFGLDMSKWPKIKKRFSKDTYPGEQWNLGDFILWHGRGKEREVYWKTELGEGRPAWNVQDPAIILKHLDSRIDIHCGGIDSLYRHHDYTRAVLECYTGEKPVEYWLHANHLLVDGRKMSKKEGNVLYINDLVERGYSPMEIRFFLIYGRYRDKLGIKNDTVDRTTDILLHLRQFSKTLAQGPERTPIDPPPRADRELLGIFESYMNDDLNVMGAVDAVTEYLRRLGPKLASGDLSLKRRAAITAALHRIDDILAVDITA